MYLWCMQVKMAAGVVEKRADTVSDRRRLAREAGVLRAVIHPGVVAVTDAERTDEGVDRLVLRRVGGRPLCDLVPCPASVAAGWVAAVATIVADLHDIGYAHCALTAEHVLIDGDGHPVVCGFGAATALREAEDPTGLVLGDIRALARLMLESAPTLDRRAGRRLARWAEVGQRRHRSARALATELVRVVPDAHLAPPSEPATPVASDTGIRLEAASDGPAPTDLIGDADRTVPARHRATAAARADRGLGTWPVRLSAVAAISIMVLGVALATGRLHSSHGSPRPSTGYVLRSAPGETDLAVTGRWGCGPPRPAVLDAVSGAVWVFDRWPAPRQRVSARFVTRVPGATGLGVVTRSSSCDRLVVLRAGRPDIDLDLGRPA